MIDRTEQEILFLSFIAQNYYKTKGSNTERHKAHPVRRLMRLKQHRDTVRRMRTPLSLHRKEKYRGKRYRSVVY